VVGGDHVGILGQKAAWQTRTRISFYAYCGFYR
jgi:hypothetical protein